MTSIRALGRCFWWYLAAVGFEDFSDGFSSHGAAEEAIVCCFTLTSPSRWLRESAVMNARGGSPALGAGNAPRTQTASEEAQKAHGGTNSSFFPSVKRNNGGLLL